MIRLRFLLNVVVLIVFSYLLVSVESGYAVRKRNYRENLWNPDQQHQQHQQQQPLKQASPRFDYDTGYATGVAMKKALGLTKIVLSPIVLPMIFFVGIVLLLFFAVVGSSAVVGQASSFGRNKIPYHYRPTTKFGQDWSSRSVKLASDVLSSDQCIEKISCELLRKARHLGAENLIMSAIQEMPTSSSESVVGRISRSLKNPSNCNNFSCSSLSMISRAIKSLRGG